jgi:hypothetical protein
LLHKNEKEKEEYFDENRIIQSKCAKIVTVKEVEGDFKSKCILTEEEERELASLADL